MADIRLNIEFTVGVMGMQHKESEQNFNIMCDLD